jgi:hypothetical protein
MYRLIDRSKLLFSKAFPLLVITVILLLTATATVQAQLQIKGEPATANFKVNEKVVALKANIGGYFQRISNISPNASVPVEIYYPNGIEGEKVVLSVLDGGKIEGAETPVKVIYLTKEKKCLFNFQVTNQSGIFRIKVYKGADEKVVQLWVGPELKPVLQ